MKSSIFKCLKEFPIETIQKKKGEGTFQKKGIELVSLDGEWHFHGFLYDELIHRTNLEGKTFKVEWEIYSRTYNKDGGKYPMNDIKIESLKPLTEVTQRELDILKMMIGAELAKEKATDLPF